MDDLILEESEEIIEHETEVEWVHDDYECDVLDDFYLTNKNLIISYEKSTGLFKSEKTTVKIKLSDISKANGKFRVEKVDDDDYDKVLQIKLKSGKKHLFAFDEDKELDVWYESLMETLNGSVEEKVVDEANSICPICGEKNLPNAKFCSSCGETFVIDETKKTKKKKEDSSHCPNCHASIKSFETECPYCNTEIRNIEPSDALDKFSKGLNEIVTKPLPTFEETQSLLKKTIGIDFQDREKRAEFERQQRIKRDKEVANYIINYPVPNSKEDLMEFMLLISSNINEKKDFSDEVQTAWRSKLTQVYEKAKLSFKNGKELDKINNIYQNVDTKLTVKKNKSTFWIVLFILSDVIMVLIIFKPFFGLAALFVVLSIASFVYYKINKGNKVPSIIVHIICLIFIGLAIMFLIMGINNLESNNINYQNYYNEEIEKNDVTIEIEFVSNLIFSRYDVTLEVYDIKKDLPHGEDKVINLKLPNGKHKLKFSGDGMSKTVELVVNGNTRVKYKLSCHMSEIKVLELSIENDDDKVKEYTINFDTDGGNSIDSIKVKENEKVNLPNNPTKEGYNFKYWKVDNNEFDKDTKVTKDLTLKAEWEEITIEPNEEPSNDSTNEETEEYKVSFDTDCDEVIDPITVKKGEKIVLPSEPIKANHVFVYWMLDDEKFDVNTIIDKDITLKAKWKEETEDCALKNTKYDLAFARDGVDYKDYIVFDFKNKIVRSLSSYSSYAYKGTYTGDFKNGVKIKYTYENGWTETFKYSGNNGYLTLDGVTAVYYKTDVKPIQDLLNDGHHCDLDI